MNFVGEVERELDNMLTRFRPDERIEPKSLKSVVTRLGRLAKQCNQVSLATFGRRTFHHISVELNDAVEYIVNDDNHALAKAEIERARRSLIFIKAKCRIHDLMIVILALKRLRMPLSPQQTDDLKYGLKTIRIMLGANLDRGFERQVSSKTVGSLDQAIEILEVGYSFSDLDQVYKRLRQAQAPL